MVRLFAVLAALLFAPVAAFAQAAPPLPGPPECLDDDHTNRCLPEVQARSRALLGVASIEDEAASGAVIYRAFFVNGGGNDMPAVAFERRPGQSPEVVVYGRDSRSMRAPVDAETWARVQGQSVLADRIIQPLDPSDTSPPLCLHSWVQTVEIANAPRERFLNEPVRRRTEDACGGGPATLFAFSLAAMAVETIPWCARLERDGQSNSLWLLTLCLRLSGDRIAAADLYNAAYPDGEWEQHADMTDRLWRQRLGMNSSTVLTWGDQVVRSGSWSLDELLAFLQARFAEHDNLRFSPTEIEGVNAYRVIVRGNTAYDVDDVWMGAEYRQTWVWDQGVFEWDLLEWIVEPYEAVP